MSAAPPEIRFDAPAVERGVGLFETLLVLDHRVSWFAAHCARLIATAQRFELPAPTNALLVDTARRALALDLSGGERALRLTWLAIGAELDAPASWRLDATTRPIAATTLERRIGCRAVTLPPEYARDTPTAKSTSYLAGVLGLRYAERRGANEGFFLAADGRYLEGTATALLAWNHGEPIAAATGTLPSVTATAFLDHLAGPSRPLTERPLRRADLRAGALVVGALTRAAPLRSLDGDPCEQPPDMLDVIARFNRHLDEKATLLSPEEESDEAE